MSAAQNQLPRLANAIQQARETSGESNPTERLVYWSDRHNVGAVMDPFTPYRCGVVACLGEVAAPDKTAHLADVPYSRRQILGLVVHAIGGKLLHAARTFGEDEFVIEQNGDRKAVPIDQAGEERVLERVVGFAEPRVPHVVMGLNVRHEAPRSGRVDDVTLNRYWGMARIIGEEASALDTRLDAQAVVGPILDDPRDPHALELMERMATLIG